MVMYAGVDHFVSEPAALTQLLDEHHLVVLSDDHGRQARLISTLIEYLAILPETRLVMLPGPELVDLESICTVFERHFNGEHRIERSIRGLVRLLRNHTDQPKHQYFFWPDADALLEADVKLFGRVVNALLSVAAEREHVSAEVLALQRFIFIGGSKLGAYAEDEHGQFHSWLLERGATRFWEVVSCLDRPPVLTFRLEG
jgi:hypothetical protein